MPLFSRVKGVRIPEMVCALPAQKFSLQEYAPNLFTEKTAARMAKNTGFYSLRITPDEMTTADLFTAAAEKLLAGQDKKEIAALVFVTQTPDYDVPATSHVLQNRLGLSNDVLCIDVNEGCSGFVTGLYIAASLCRDLGKKILLGCGDTISKVTSPNDRATRGIFGDEAAAILIEPGNFEIPFAFTSYGDRYEAIIHRNSRHRKSPPTELDGCSYIDGVEILNFALNEVPSVINSFMRENNLTDENISLYACHQANKLILESLADKLNVPREKVPFTSGNIGNESSASIPSVITRGGGGAIKMICSEKFYAVALALAWPLVFAVWIFQTQKLLKLRLISEVINSCRYLTL